MERSRSKRYYYDQDYESENLHSRSKRKNSYGGGGGGRGRGHHYAPSYYRRSYSSGGGRGGGGGGGGRKMLDPSLTVTTSFRILCRGVKAGGVIGKNGSIIKAIRNHTGASINVHDLIPGDDERIIEIFDTRRRDPEGRMPPFSPAQEALFLIHDRILETDVGFREEDGGGGRVVTRLVVSKTHVGCLLGKGGKIIQQMKTETKTHIRILPRDQTLPRCVAMSEEIVQVVGDMNAVKNAIASIASRLRESQHRDRSQESQHRDRSHFHNQLHSPDRFFLADDDFHRTKTPKRSSEEGPTFGSRYSRSNSNFSCSSGFAAESAPTVLADNTQSFPHEDLVFRILCPADKVDRVVGESDGIVNLLQDKMGVTVEVSEPIAGSDEHVIIISSNEGPDDELFPAQEALLHIQTRIVDLVPEKGNIITTRLLLQSDEILSLLELGKVGGAKIEILQREELPAGLSRTDEIVQIVGEIKAAREALVEVTSRVRSYIYREFLEKDSSAPQVSVSGSMDTTVEPDVPSGSNATPTMETPAANVPVVSTPQSSSTAAAQRKVKDVGPPNVEKVKQNANEQREDQPTGSNRISVPLVARSTLEVVIPPHAASELVKKSRKLVLISELSGANVKLIDDRPEATEKMIQISGTPEQAARAQSLLQGFILSTEEDGP